MYEKLKDEAYNSLGGINVKASDYITGQNQFLDIRNLCFERPGALTSRPGRDANATLLKSTYGVLPSSYYQFIKPDGASFRLVSSGQTLYSLESGVVGHSLHSADEKSPSLDFVNFDTLLYMANGYSFQRFDGTFTVQYEIPKQRNFIVGAFATIHTGSVGSTNIVESGVFRFRYAHVKNYGSSYTVVGERIANDELGINVEAQDTIAATLIDSNKHVWAMLGFTIPPGYGISQIAVYMARPGTSLNFLGSPTLYSFVPDTSLGTTLYGITFPDYRTNTNWDNAPAVSLIPSYLETYKNMLFQSGFSLAGSRVAFSNIADQEHVPFENFVEIRSGNDDIIKGMKVYQQNLVVFKENSVHEITGDSPETLSVKDTTLEYGAVNNEAIVTFGNKLWFMDKRGVCEYNGPNTFIVSYPVQEILDTVNLYKCRALHYKKLNQVWFSCEELTFVYDYDIGAWSINNTDEMDIDNAAGLLLGSDEKSDIAHIQDGTSHYVLSKYSPSLTADLGAAITYSIKTRFHKRMGDSTEELFRRLFLDFDTGVTLDTTVDMYSDYSDSASHSITGAISDFQKRFDFGVPAKALSVEIITSSTALVTFNGYTIESRYLRGV